MRVLELDVPEFFVTDVGKVERLGSCVRFLMCVRRGDVLEPKYSCIWPIELLLTRNELVARAGHAALGEMVTH